MKKLLFLLTILALLASCHKEEDPDNHKQKELFDRTVLVYISGENNLSYEISKELEEMRTGSQNLGNNALVIFVDDANKTQRPYVIRMNEGAATDTTFLESDNYSSDPALLRQILNYTSEHYTAREYGLVLWGHSSGWLLDDSISTTRTTAARSPLKAYGVDTGTGDGYSANGKWMNMYTLNKTICEWGHLKFIFADCCQFQCVESAYELRHATDYIIASPAEVPAKGAPYNTITKALFDTSEQFYQTIVDCYFEQSFRINYYLDSWTSISYVARTPFSVVRTSELDQLAAATNTILHTFLPTADTAAWPDLSKAKLIYYRGNINDKLSSLMYDMNDVMLRYADTQLYSIWKQALDRAVIYKVNASTGWMTASQILPYVFGMDSYGQATEVILTDERYGGISMFVPQDRPKTWYEPYTSNGVKYDGYNASIKKTAWYYAARLSEFGW